MVNYNETLPMSANRVQFLKKSTKIIYILRGVQLSLALQRSTGLQNTQQAKIKTLFTKTGQCSQNIANRTYYVFHLNYI